MRPIATWSPRSPYKKIHPALLENGTPVISVTGKCSRKPRVNAAVKFRRLGKQYETWTAEDWNKVMFAKESPLKQFVMPKRILGRIGKRFDEKYIFQSRQQPPSQRICGIRSKYGTAGLCFLPSKITINGARYVDRLLEKHQRIIFMHDGALWHWTKFVQNFYNRIKVTTLGWPGNITDLNPIENS